MSAAGGDEAGDSGRAWTLSVGLTCAVVLARAAMVTWTIDARQPALVPRVLDGVVPLAAAALLAFASRRPGPSASRQATAWRYLAAAFGSYAAAESLWAFFGSTFDTPPTSYVAFALYLLFYPLFLLGVLHLPDRPLGRREGLPVLLDMSIALLGAALVLFALVVRPTVAHGLHQPLKLVFTTAAPAGDLAVLWALLSLVLRRRAGALPPAHALLAGCAACFVVTDVLYAYHLGWASPRLMRVLPVGWIAAHSLAGLAAVRTLLRLDVSVAAPAPAEDPRRRPRASLYAAYASLAVAALALSSGRIDQRSHPAFVLILLILGLVLARRLVGTAEGERLKSDLAEAHRELEQRVVERAEELRAANLAHAAEIEVRRRAEERIQLELRRLASLRAIDQAIGGSVDLGRTLDVFLAETTGQLRVDAAAVLLLDPVSQTLVPHARRGFRTDPPEEEPLPIGEGHGGLAALERQVVYVADLSARPDVPSRGRTHAAEGFRALSAAPLVTRGQVLGILEVYSRGPLDADEEWLAFLATLAGQGAIAVDSATLFERIQRSNAALAKAYDSTLRGWALALELRDHETQGHSQRVTETTVRLARAFGVEEEALVQVRRGALLHDIGKIAIPDDILLKTGPLTDEEWAVMRRHPVHAFDLLSHVAYLRPALDIPYCHHEHWDGGGYPRGLAGADIPLAARLFSVVDNWDALSFARPYREAWPPDRVRRHIEERAGTLFDAEAVRLFFEACRPGGAEPRPS